MANTANVPFAMTINAAETFDTGVAGNEGLASAQSVLHNAFNKSGTLNAESSVPATTIVSFEQALTAGAAEIDLTSLPGTNGDTVSFNGLKVQLCMFRGKAGNANPITVQPDTGGTDDYEMMGAAFKAVVEAEQQVMFFGNNAAPDVGATDKIFSLAGTGAQVLEIIMVAG